MRTPTYLCRFARRLAIAAGLLMVSAHPAYAISGLYLHLSGGIADYSGNELILAELPEGDVPDENPDTCCAGTAIAAQFRVGYSIFGFGGPEFVFIGTGFNSFNGGGGFIGGGLRLYPLRFLSLAGLDTESFPIDLSVAGSFGYTLVGQDFAYEGTFWDIDTVLMYKLTSFMSIGARLNVILPNFDDFVFTSFSGDRGRCLDGNGQQDFDPANPTSSPRESLECNGRGPDTTILSPQVLLAFHFNLFGL